MGKSITKQKSITVNNTSQSNDLYDFNKIDPKHLEINKRKNCFAVILGIIVSLMVFLIPLVLSFIDLSGGMSWIELVFAGAIIGGFMGYQLGLYIDGEEAINKEEILKDELNEINQEISQNKISLTEDEKRIRLFKEITDEKRTIILLISIFISSLLINSIYLIILLILKKFDIFYLIGIGLFIVFFLFGTFGTPLFFGKRKYYIKKILSFISNEILWLFFEIELLYQWAIASNKISQTLTTGIAAIWIVYALLVFGSMIFVYYFFDLKEKFFKKIFNAIKKISIFKKEDFKGNFAGSLLFVLILSVSLLLLTAVWLLPNLFVEDPTLKWVIPIILTILGIGITFVILERYHKK